MSINDLLNENLDKKTPVRATISGYGLNEEYYGVFIPEISAVDLLPSNISVVRDTPNYAMGGGNILGMTFRNQGLIYLGTFWGDENKEEEVLTHEILHNTHSRGNEEMAVRYATAKTLNEWDKSLGNHSKYFIGNSSQFYH